MTVYKVWKDMSEHVQNAIAGHYARGGTVEYSHNGVEWDEKINNTFKNDVMYRKTEKSKILKTVSLYGGHHSFKEELSFDEEQINTDLFKITFKTINSIPDWSTIKGETL
jgi:hypothetical protein